MKTQARMRFPSARRPGYGDRQVVMIEHHHDREKALEPFGLTGREAEWVALVCLHSGVFTRAQFCHFFEGAARIRALRFVRALVERGLAVEFDLPNNPGGARVALEGFAEERHQGSSSRNWTGTELHNAGREKRKHRAGTGGAVSGAPHGLPIPLASQGPAGQAGPGLSASAQGGLRSRMLLARTRLRPWRTSAAAEPDVLHKKD